MHLYAGVHSSAWYLPYAVAALQEADWVKTNALKLVAKYAKLAAKDSSEKYKKVKAAIRNGIRGAPASASAAVPHPAPSPLIASTSPTAATVAAATDPSELHEDEQYEIDASGNTMDFTGAVQDGRDDAHYCEDVPYFMRDATCTMQLTAVLPSAAAAAAFTLPAAAAIFPDANNTGTPHPTPHTPHPTPHTLTRLQARTTSPK